MPALSSLVLLLGLSGAALADPAQGLWRTEPDRKALVSHIRIAPCGGKLCGTVEAAFRSDGTRVTTPNVGKRLFWDMVPRGSGRYDGGTAYVPLLNVTVRAHMLLDGNRLTVTGCKGPVCDGQVWTRVR